MRLFRRVRLDAIQPGLLALTIILVSFGSSGITELREIGRVRWLALAALMLVALLAAMRRGRVRVVRGPYAAAGAFLALAFLSSAWSVLPRLTFERSVSFALVLGAAGGLAYAAAGRPSAVERLMGAILVAAAVIAAAGIVLLIAANEQAVAPAAGAESARLRGIGENPNTVPLLLALALPIAVWSALGAPSAARRAAAWALALLFFATILLSGSQGALVGALAGVVAVFVLMPARAARRVVTALAAVGVFAIGFAAFPAPDLDFQQIVEEARESPGQVSVAVEGDGGVVYRGAVVLAPATLGSCRQEDQVGRPIEGRPSPQAGRLGLFGSGRGQAWQRAFDQATERPLAGFGFGTEDRVFSNCFFVFQGARPENSYLGVVLQLGVAGLAALAWLAAALLRTALRLVRDARVAPAAAGCVAVVIAGGALAVVQSYVYAAGNIATLSFWTCAFLLTAVAAFRAPATALAVKI